MRRIAITKDFPDSAMLSEVEEGLRDRLLKFFDDHLARKALSVYHEM